MIVQEIGKSGKYEETDGTEATEGTEVLPLLGMEPFQRPLIGPVGPFGCLGPLYGAHVPIATLPSVLSLILPTYNESESLPVLLPKLAAALKGLEFEVIVVDDDSPDRTWEVAQKLSAGMPQLRVIRRVGRRGLSSAVIEGFLSARGSVLAVADADGQHDLGILPKLDAAVREKGGVAIGSRYAEGGSVGEWDERRHALSRAGTRMAIALCKVEVKDPMSGFFAIDRSLFERTFPRLNPKGFKILLDVLIHIPADTPVSEVPFTFGVRERGESKLSRRVQIEFLEYLYDATVGRYVPLTFLKYAMVGALGVVVHLAAYVVVSRFVLHQADVDVLGFPLALVAGMEAAIVFNFLLNNSWTFSSAKLRGWRAVAGFLRFNLACAVGAFANYAVTLHLRGQGSPELLSVAVGAFLGMIWNYTMSRMVTWRA